MSTIVLSDQSSVFIVYISVRKLWEVPRIVLHREVVHSMMAKTKTTPRATTSGRIVSAAAKHPTTTSKFLDTIDEVLTIFDDSISSITSEERDEAYKCFATTYREACSLVWDKISNADIPTILNAVPDQELVELGRMRKLLNPSTPQPKVLTEQRKVPALEQILGAMTAELPKQKLPNSQVCGLIADVFSDLAKAHSAQAQAAKGLANLATTVTPEQMTLILAAVVPPTLQLSLPAGTISPLSAPPPQPVATTTREGHHDIVMFCKSQILPDPKAEGFLKYERKSPTRVLAVALYIVLERKYFEEKTSRSDIASMFSVTTAQLTKAVMGVDYESRPHQTKRKRKTGADGTTPSKVPKTSADATPSTSRKDSSKFVTDAEKEDTLTSLSSSDSMILPEVPF